MGGSDGSDDDDQSDILQLDGVDSLASSSTRSISDNELTFSYSIAPDNSFVNQASALRQEACPVNCRLVW